MLNAISTYSLTNDLRQSISETQLQLVKSQRELSSGRVANLSEALGGGVARDFSLGIRREELQAISQTNTIVASRLEATQATLTGIVQNAEDLRSALISSQNIGNALVSQNQATMTFSTFISTLNTNASGEYIFGGINIDNAPIVDYFAAPPSANKLGVDAQFLSAFGVPQSSPGVSAITAPQMQSFLSGPFANLFSSANWNADWSNASNQAIQSRISLSQTTLTSVTANDPALQKLTMAYTMVSDLGLGNLSVPAYQTVVQTATQLIDEALAGLNQTQAGVGMMQQSVMTANNQIASQQGLLEIYVGDLENIEPAEAALKINDLMTQIETAYALTAKISQLSLVKYL
jgi:flagellar hook-associated protein 3 FlgL